MRNRLRAGRTEAWYLRRNVMTRANRVVGGETQGAWAGMMVQLNNAFISRTAWSRPTSTARAMMLWPILYSTISGM